MIFDKTISDIDSDDYVPCSILPWVSQDWVFNTRGTRLLEFCKVTGMQLANGRLYRDFNVEQFNMFSDHAPLYFQFAIKKPMQNNTHAGCGP